MIKTKKGFTLVELLAVIVILAIIMVIATQSVGKTITRSRTQAFNETMELAAKNAKRILQTDGTLDDDSLSQSLSYSSDEYNFYVVPVNDGYIVRLISNAAGKFKNVNFDEITQNTNWKYWKDANGELGKNIISFKIDSVGDLREISSTEDKKIAKGDLNSKCTTNYVKKTSSETYQVGDLISFCNNDVVYKLNGAYVKGKSEDFYVISDNGNTVSALASHNLMVGSTATDEYATLFPGLQALPQTNGRYKDYEVAFAEKKGLSIIGYWANDDGNLSDGYINKNQTSYSADVFDSNSLLWEPIQNYKKYFTSTLNKPSVNMRLITFKELVRLGCTEASYGSGSCLRSKGTWIYNTNYWTASAYDKSHIWRLSKNGYSFFAQNFWSSGSSWDGVRPVIEISKSEI